MNLDKYVSEIILCPNQTNKTYIAPSGYTSALSHGTIAIARQRHRIKRDDYMSDLHGWFTINFVSRIMASPIKLNKGNVVDVTLLTKISKVFLTCLVESSQNYLTTWV